MKRKTFTFLLALCLVLTLLPAAALADGPSIDYDPPAYFDSEHYLMASRTSGYSTTTYTYNDHGDVIKAVYTSGTPYTETHAYTYDNAGRMLTHKVVEYNKVTAYTYDAKGNMLSEVITYSTGYSETRTWTYNADGTMATSTDVNGTIKYTYDANGNLIKSSGNSEYAYTYDAGGNRLTETYTGWDGTPQVSTYEYDSQGRLVKEYDADNKNNITYVYDNAGNCTKKTDRFGEATYTYDAHGNMLSEVHSGQPDYTVSYTYVERPAAPVSTGFADVAATDYYADAVKWAVSEGITNGTSGTTFSPVNTCTRGQIITFLYRAAGEPAVTGVSVADVKPGDYYYNAVLWAKEMGMMSGEEFKPGDDCTRAMAVEFMWKAAGSPSVSGSGAFTDVDSGASYAGAVAWALENGVTTGTSTTTFSPDNTCTRGQIVTFLYRGFAE